MTANNRFAYIQARLQARHGMRPGEEGWQRLESATDLGGYLQQARTTRLAPWVQHLPPQASVHQIEQSVRRQWEIYASDIAAWSPREWRPAIDWTGNLPTLPFVAHLARGGAVRPWMLKDSTLAPLALEDYQQRQEAFSASPLASLIAAIGRGESPITAWLEDWEKRWPHKGDPSALRELRHLVGKTLRSFLEDHDGQQGGSALRADLAGRLTGFFRREAGQIGAVFAHLGLMLLDIERLRGGLALRALFTDPRERPRWA